MSHRKCSLVKLWLATLINSLLAFTCYKKPWMVNAIYRWMKKWTKRFTVGITS
jgi:hypothetical protein